MFVFWRITLFCLGYRFSKHKITVCSKNFFGEGHDAVGLTPMLWRHSVTSLQFTHVRSFACRGRLWNLRTGCSTFGLYYVTIQQQICRSQDHFKLR